MELKGMTLKDIKRWKPKGIDCRKSNIFTTTKSKWGQIPYEVLKHWGIAKIGVLQAECDILKNGVCSKCGRDNCGSESTITMLETMIDWIMENFNLKEEDIDVKTKAK